MSSGLASLYKILKDETRSKIILLLNEKGSFSYTDLMETMGFVTTGLLNYHLKVLDGLLTKNENGEYVLSEKGKLASRLLVEFPEENRQHLGLKPKWWRKFWIGAAFFVTVSLIISFAAYFLGYTDLAGLYRSAISIVGAIGIAYMIQHVTREMLSKKTQLILNKIAYTGLGVWLGLTASFFGVVLLSLLSMRLGGPSIAKLIDNTLETFLVNVVPPIIGGILGYRFGKKRGFKRPEPKWAI